MIRTIATIFTVGALAACNQNTEPAAETAAKAEAKKPTVAAAAKKEAPKEIAKAKPVSADSVPVLSVVETEAAIKSGATIVDANGAETREKFGVIPGALKLANYRKYDPTSVLPKDKASKLVFYCSNSDCSAAPKAAAKAMTAGYTNVSHLKVGIKGWVEAGKDVTKG